MDVINLHKFGIKNVVANLGTAMTERQIDLIWRFFRNPIICLDGDSSGRKAAIRAAERLLPLMKADLNIHFLTLSDNLDPDAFINKNGKDAFINFVKSKVEIQNFLWDAYFQDVNKNDPRSLSLFEKKIKDLCKSINDKTLGKYFLDYFLKRINELTPNINIKNNYFLKYKNLNPLQKTKDIFNKKNKFKEKELKEFSILYLIINNLDAFRKNIELISDINFSTDLLMKFKKKMIDYLLDEKFFENKKIKLEDFNDEFKSIIELVNHNASVKIIIKNKTESQIITIFNEIVEENKKIELREKIESLEHEVSLNLDENLYSELLSLRNQLKSG
jgi:DNA primase